MGPLSATKEPHTCGLCETYSAVLVDGLLHRARNFFGLVNKFASTQRTGCPKDLTAAREMQCLGIRQIHFFFQHFSQLLNATKSESPDPPQIGIFPDVKISTQKTQTTPDLTTTCEVRAREVL